MGLYGAKDIRRRRLACEAAGAPGAPAEAANTGCAGHDGRNAKVRIEVKIVKAGIVEVHIVWYVLTDDVCSWLGPSVGSATRLCCDEQRRLNEVTSSGRPAREYEGGAPGTR